MFDLLVMDLKQEIIEKLNASGVPTTVMAYMLKELSDMANSSLQAEINRQKQEREEQKRMEEAAKLAAQAKEQESKDVAPTVE
jgi:hypothetical protein